MIKEQKKISKYNCPKSKQELIIEYTRTIVFSIVFAIVITVTLAVHARNEMLNSLITNPEEVNRVNRELAKQMIEQADLLRDLKNKNYAVCLYVGELYETAGDYPNAQIAYEFATEKAKPDVYKHYGRLINVLIYQNKIDYAEGILNNIKDKNERNLIKLKTRAYIMLGDKYYSQAKFIKAAKSYEKADFYYNKFSKKDKVITESIKNKIVNSYRRVAGIMVRSELNSDAVRFLKKAAERDPENYNIQYKLAIILSDYNPEESLKYFNKLLEVIPQEIDYGVYINALRNAATIAEIEGRKTQAKYYRYKIHSLDIFTDRKVVYKNDIEPILASYKIKNSLFTYRLYAVYNFVNRSGKEIDNLFGDFVLTYKDKPIETFTATIADKKNPLSSASFEPAVVKVQFNKKFLTRKELANYTIKIYLYKDKKFKTLISETGIHKKKDKKKGFSE